MTNFTEFGLAKPILNAIAREGHTTATPIQAEAIPQLLKGRDLLGIAQTGTGKTAAFALPILHHLASDRRRLQPRECRALILAPTRELALQVRERFDAYGAAQGLTTGLVIGGVAFGKQRAMLHRGVDILVATPGRLIDVADKGALKLTGVEFFVLDEVDQMLDLGFIHSIRSIAGRLPENRQNIFFSATMPRSIAKLASSLLNNPARVEIAAAKPLKIDQSVMFIEKPAKPDALVKVVKDPAFERGLVFARTKHGADKLVRKLNAAGASAHAIHGNRSQGQREKALNAFRSGKTRILVATDIAARGIDVRDVTHVVNYDLPNTPETYTHRIGRTGRAGATGIAISFCSGEERPFLRAIEKLTRETMAVIGERPAEIQTPSGDNRRRAPLDGKPPRRKKKPPHRREQSQHRQSQNEQRQSRPNENSTGRHTEEQQQEGQREQGQRKAYGKRAQGQKPYKRNGQRKNSQAQSGENQSGAEQSGSKQHSPGQRSQSRGGAAQRTPKKGYGKRGGPHGSKPGATQGATRGEAQGNKPRRRRPRPAQGHKAAGHAG